METDPNKPPRSPGPVLTAPLTVRVDAPTLETIRTVAEGASVTRHRILTLALDRGLALLAAMSGEDVRAAVMRR
jgi:hypothetical protein